MSLQKLQRILFFLILVFLPTNLAKHFEFDFSFISGTLVDYLIPTIYLTDVLSLILFMLWGLELVKSEISFKRLSAFFKKRINIILLLFLIFATPTVKTINTWAAWFGWLHLLEGVLLVFYVGEKIRLSRDFAFIVLASSVGIFYEGILATLQWFFQRSVFSYLFLGEPVYTSTALGVSSISINGREFVRSYGTFPHPNVLGGYLALFLPWLLAEILRRNKSSWRRCYYTLVFTLGVSALFFSFGRVAWVTALLGLFCILLFCLSRNSSLRLKKRQSSLVIPLIIISLTFGGMYIKRGGISQTLSWILRYELLRISLRMIIENPLFGVGLNNFIVRMMAYGHLPVTYQFLQPVHNIFFLIASELGIVGIFIFGVLLFYTFKKVILSRNKTLVFYMLVSLVQLVVLGMFDHYLITLQQGRLMFFLVIGFVAGI